MNSRPRIALLGAGESGTFIEGWREALLANGAEPVRLVGMDEDTLEKCGRVDGVMCHYSHRRPDFLLFPAVLDALEEFLGLPVFPCRRMRILFDRKDLQSQAFRALGLPSVPTWNTDSYERFAEETQSARLPLVVKYVCGAGSSQVALARSRKELLELGRKIATRKPFPALLPLRTRVRRFAGTKARAVLRTLRAVVQPSHEMRMAHLTPWQAEDVSERPPVLFWQEFVKGNPGDIRVTVIGDRAFTFRRGNRPGDFRASGSGRLQYEHAHDDRDAVELAFDAERRLGVGNVAFDFLRTQDGQPIFVEMSYGYLSSAVANCPGHWQRDGNWVEGSRVPEELHVEWFLGQVRGRSGGA